MPRCRGFAPSSSAVEPPTISAACRMGDTVQCGWAAASSAFRWAFLSGGAMSATRRRLSCPVARADRSYGEGTHPPRRFRTRRPTARCFTGNTVIHLLGLVARLSDSQSRRTVATSARQTRALGGGRCDPAASSRPTSEAIGGRLSGRDLFASRSRDARDLPGAKALHSAGRAYRRGSNADGGCQSRARNWRSSSESDRAPPRSRRPPEPRTTTTSTRTGCSTTVGVGPLRRPICQRPS